MAELPDRVPTREARAIEMLRTGLRAAEGKNPGEFVIPSRSGHGLHCVSGIGIEEAQETCDCEDFLARQAPCAHIYFARHWITNPPEPESRVQEPSERQIRSPRSPTYGLARRREGEHFPILLKELCKGVSEPARDSSLAGRKPIPLRDQVFCAIQKTYECLSAERTSYVRAQAARAGFIERDYYFDVVSKFLCRPESTDILMDVLARSAFPLRAFENRCVADSTGFRTTRFHQYREEKYNPGRRNTWLKAHALVGVRTHAVVSVDISEGSAGDAPRFPLLLQRAKDAGFEFKEVLADKAYNSRKNFDVAESMGMTAIIPFKSSQTGQARGSSAYHKMFLFFSYHREKFDEHYRDRGQVEVTFGAIKQKIGETIMSRNFHAQVNELMCKLIVHNITMLIQSMYSLGVLPDFLEPRPPTQEPPTAYSQEIAENIRNLETVHLFDSLHSRP